MAAVQNSVVIVNYNGGRTLPPMLAALQLHEAPATEVFVVDNASFDDSRKTIRSEFPNVRIIKISQNHGFAAAAQVGFKEAAGDVVVFSHHDLIVPMHSLAELADHVREGEGRRVAAALPRLIDRERNELPFVGRLPGLARGMLGKFSPATARRCVIPSLDHVADHEWAFMPAVAIRADILATIGGFDPRFFLYWHDADLCQRLHERSWRISIRRDVTVVHMGSSPNDPPTSSGFAQIMRKDQQRYFEKHRPKWEQGVLSIDTKINKLLKREPA